MKKLCLFIFIFFVSFNCWSQYIYWGNSVTCHGGSDGYIEIDFPQLWYIDFGCIPWQLEWSTGETTASIYNLSAGGYLLTITACDGTVNEIHAFVDGQTQINISDSVINSSCELCYDGEIYVDVSGGTSPYQFNWSNGSSTQNIYNLENGYYNLTITDNNGCVETNEYSILHNPPDTQKIELAQGWNMFSTYKSNASIILDSLLYSIQGNYSNIKNWEGEVYMPQYGANTIDSVEHEYGFQIKMILADTLMVTGTTYNPEDLTINLPSGWCMIGYPRYIDGNITEMMSSIVNHILIMKDDDGKVYWPNYGVNLINVMHPGDAYQIKTDTILNFTYPAYSSIPAW